MNFFQHQDEARRNTRWLIFLFVIAVLILVLLTNLFIYMFPWQTHSASFADHGTNQSLSCLFQSGCEFWSSINWQKAVWVSLIVIGTIGGVSLFKWFSILSGGKSIAVMMGGELLRSDTQSVQEKRLLNVVEEIALAANMPVPAVYVLNGEDTINAFAAGFGTKDAIIAVTEGSLERFNREQLQGVVAHEFSHILNGDMRLNMHLIAVLHGIMFITEVGYIFLRGNRHRHGYSSFSSTSRNKNQSATIMLGLGLVIIGAIGTFFGNLIKAAVSRQREFLADASAVQFTRNNTGIADALKKIGGHSGTSLIHNAHGAEISHLFFGQALKFSQSFFSTHPPLSERINRVQPDWDGEYLYPRSVPEEELQSEGDNDHADLAVMVSAIVVAGEALNGEPLNQQGHQVAESQDSVQELIHNPENAAASVLALLFAEDSNTKIKQLKVLEQSWPVVYQLVEAKRYAKADKAASLQLAELAVTALRLFDLKDYVRFKKMMIRFIKMDGRIDLYEWCLYQLVISALDCHFTEVKRVKLKYKQPLALKDELQIVLSLLLQATRQSDDYKQKAFDKACNTLGFYESQNYLFEAANMKSFLGACKKLEQAYPLLKARIIKALVDAVKTDGEIEPIEKHTIYAISALLEVPLPNLDFE